MKWINKIPASEIQFEFSKSGGPGGQHMNKTNSAAVLRWKVDATVAFSEDQKYSLIQKMKLTTLGDVVIRSEESRDKEKNKKRCLEKLNTLIDKALYVPKKRKPTKPTRAQKEKRIQSKKRRSDIKKLRSKKDW